MRLYGVRRLDWCGGLFYCHIWCKACRRHVIKPAHELAERYGWDKDIDWLMPRMVCTCGARNPWIITMSDPE